MSRNRQPKGIPSGGEFAPQAHTEADIDLATSTAAEVRGAGESTMPPPWSEERWMEMTPSLRASLTRNGVTYPEWAQAAAVAEENGRYSVAEQLRTVSSQVDADEAAAIMNAVSSPLHVFRPDGLDDDDLERMRSWPSGAKCATADLALECLRSGHDLDYLVEINSKVPEILGLQNSSNDRGPHRVIEMADMGIDQEVSDRYGSGDNWDRTYHAIRSGLPEDEAREWAPAYPIQIETMKERGWRSDQFSTFDMDDENYQWAVRGKFTPDEAKSWGSAGFKPDRVTRSYIDLGLTPEEGRDWYREVEGENVFGGHTTAELHRAGVDIDRVRALKAAGVELRGGSKKTLRDRPIEGLRVWSNALSEGQHPVSMDRIDAWSSIVGFDRPERAGDWIEALSSNTYFQREMANKRAMSFVNKNMDPSDFDGERHPILVATARRLDIPVDKLEEQAKRSSRGLVEGCRTAFRRRRMDPPF